MIASVIIALLQAVPAYSVEVQHLNDIPWDKVIMIRAGQGGTKSHFSQMVFREGNDAKWLAYFDDTKDYNPSVKKGKRLLLFEVDTKASTTKTLKNADDSEVSAPVYAARCSPYRAVIRDGVYSLDVIKPGTDFKVAATGYSWLVNDEIYIVSRPLRNKGNLNPLSICSDLDAGQPTLDGIYGVGAQDPSDRQKAARRFYPIALELANGDNKPDLDWKTANSDEAALALRKKTVEYLDQVMDELKKNLTEKPSEFTESESDMLAHLIQFAGAINDFKDELGRINSEGDRDKFVRKWRGYMIAELDIARDQEKLDASKGAPENLDNYRMQFVERANQTLDRWHNGGDHAKQLEAIGKRINIDKLKTVTPGSDDSMESLFDNSDKGSSKK